MADDKPKGPDIGAFVKNIQSELKQVQPDQLSWGLLDVALKVAKKPESITKDGNNTTDTPTMYKIGKDQVGSLVNGMAKEVAYHKMRRVWGLGDTQYKSIMATASDKKRFGRAVLDKLIEFDAFGIEKDLKDLPEIGIQNVLGQAEQVTHPMTQDAVRYGMMGLGPEHASSVKDFLEKKGYDAVANDHDPAKILNHLVQYAASELQKEGVELGKKQLGKYAGKRR